MINRYQGNSGKYTRIQEHSPHRVEQRTADEGARRAPDKKAGRPPAPQTRQSNQSLSGGILEKLGNLLPAGTSKIAQLESEDIILLLILYLMYKESGDSELLMIMGAMFLI